MLRAPGFHQRLQACAPSSLVRRNEGRKPLIWASIADDKLTAFLELEKVTRESLRFSNAEGFGTILAMQPFARLSLGRAGNRLQNAV